MESDDFETTVLIQQNDVRSIEVDLTDRIGFFSPTLFVYLNHISEINVSGCCFLDADLFVDTIVYCEVLCKLDMANCGQFSAIHLIRMLPKLNNLKYLDFARCCEIGFHAIYWILEETTNLNMINFDPKNPVGDVDMWEQLLRHFKDVHFGHNIRCCMPHYANYWRIPYLSDENNTE